jgi:hypothetical protein
LTTVDHRTHHVWGGRNPEVADIHASTRILLLLAAVVAIIGGWWILVTINDDVVTEVL